MMPKINSAILDGQAVISGGFSVEEAKQLSIQLNAGALPVPIDVLEQKNLGAFLGEKAMSQSLIAGLVGIFLICLFMNLIYGLNGFIANLSLFVFIVILISIYKIFGVVLTIPGIAGLILSIGMASDANILIFERIKEEQRNGKTHTKAMKLGFKEAWSSIRDSNVTLLLTALILINPLDFSFLNRSGLVRGFGITLFIGALVSLFTSITVTKIFMKIFYKENDESF
jgi:preprotein translocase subunit SecD